MNGERLMKSMRCIAAWANCALERREPIGNDYAAALRAIKAESEAAIKAESEVGK